MFDYPTYNILQSISNFQDLNVESSKVLDKKKNSSIVLYSFSELPTQIVVKQLPIHSKSKYEFEMISFLTSEFLQNKTFEWFSPLYKCFEENDTQTFYFCFPYYPSTALSKISDWSFDDWSNFIFQLSKIVFQLELYQINHNDLTLTNIMFTETENLVLIDFADVWIQDDFILGRDLNYFIYILSLYPSFPLQIYKQLEQFIVFRSHLNNELHQVNLVEPNPFTSGLFLMFKFYRPHLSIDVSFSNLLYLTVSNQFACPYKHHPFKFSFNGLISSSETDGFYSIYNLPFGHLSTEIVMLFDAINDLFIYRILQPKLLYNYLLKWKTNHPNIPFYKFSIWTLLAWFPFIYTIHNDFDLSWWTELSSYFDLDTDFSIFCFFASIYHDSVQENKLSIGPSVKQHMHLLNTTYQHVVQYHDCYRDDLNETKNYTSNILYFLYSYQTNKDLELLIKDVCYSRNDCDLLIIYIMSCILNDSSLQCQMDKYIGNIYNHLYSKEDWDTLMHKFIYLSMLHKVQFQQPSYLFRTDKIDY